jgi:hypothetical protein
MSIIWMADYTQLHHDNSYGFLQWNPFSDYMQTQTVAGWVEKGVPKFTFQYEISTKVLGNVSI